MMMMMGRFVLVSLCVIIVSSASAQAASFRCSAPPRPTCDSIIDYVSPNATNLNSITTLFGLTTIRSILGVNDLPVSTPGNHPVSANQTIRVPIPCSCSNGAGRSNRVPVYTVVAGDGLFHIASDIFSNLVTYQEIQEANNIPDANQIDVGQRLYIPLPCSCDEVDGQRVVHYGHVVAPNSTVEGIARRYNTTQDVLLKLNDLASPNDLLAGAVLDVPLRACTSQIGNNSLDYPMLLSNGTYALTAGDCVKCSCDAANNWTLQCEPAQQLNSSIWQTCPSMQCQLQGGLVIGNTTSSGCSTTTCSYGGYTNTTIITTPTVDSATCPDSGNDAPALGFGFNFIVAAFHLLLLLCLHLC